MCISPRVKSRKENGKEMSLHQLACDLEQVTSLSVSSSARGAVPFYDPLSPFLCFFVPSSIWHWL